LPARCESLGEKIADVAIAETVGHCVGLLLAENHFLPGVADDSSQRLCRTLDHGIWRILP